jgi:hypothetical protein
VAEDLRRRGLDRPDSDGGRMELYFTDVDRFAGIAARFLGMDIPLPQHADL